MIICYAIDENYVDYAKVSARSVLKYNPDATIILVSEKPLSIDVEDKNIIISLPKTFRNRGRGDRITNTAYLKLFLTKLKYDKIIYLDGDTICQGSLKELWDMDIPYIGLTESHTYGVKQAKALGLKKYGLSGMMVMNLKNLRKIGFTEKCLAVEKTMPTPSTGWQHEESILNYCMNDKFKFLPLKYNYCFNRHYNNPVDYNEVKIMHFPGKDKSEMLKYAKNII